MKKYKHIGYWWNDKNIELIEKDGNVYALHGWNGEKYNKCWKCTGDHNMESSKEKREKLLNTLDLLEIENTNGKQFDYVNSPKLSDSFDVLNRTVKKIEKIIYQE